MPTISPTRSIFFETMQQGFNNVHNNYNKVHFTHAPLAQEQVELERLRRIALEDANTAYEQWERQRRIGIAVQLEEMGRNEQCIQRPWASCRPRELAVQEMWRVGQQWERMQNLQLALQLEIEERFRRETLDEALDVVSDRTSLSWEDVGRIEEEARQEKVRDVVDVEVEKKYADVLDEFESFVDEMGRLVEHNRGHELMEMERLSRMQCQGSGTLDSERTEIRRTVVSLEETERLDRIVRDCSTNYRSIQLAEITPVLNSVRKFAESRKRYKNQKKAIDAMEQERVRRILSSIPGFSVL